MSELVNVLSQDGFENVKTYIQSGNIILESPLKQTQVKDEVQKLIKKHFELTITVFVLTSKELIQIAENNPFIKKDEKNKVFITLLESEPNAELIEKMEAIDFGEEEYFIDKDILYFYVPNGMSNSKLNNTFIENKLKVKATGRNLNTMNKLLDLASYINN